MSLLTPLRMCYRMNLSACYSSNLNKFNFFHCFVYHYKFIHQSQTSWGQSEVFAICRTSRDLIHGGLQWSFFLVALSGLAYNLINPYTNFRKCCFGLFLCHVMYHPFHVNTLETRSKAFPTTWQWALESKSLGRLYMSACSWILVKLVVSFPCHNTTTVFFIHYRIARGAAELLWKFYLA